MCFSKNLILAATLKSRSALRLMGDLMGQDGDLALACAHRANMTLESISIEAALWAHASCHAFIEALEVDTTLKHLIV